MNAVRLFHGFLGDEHEWVELAPHLPAEIDLTAAAQRLPQVANWHQGIQRLSQQIPDGCLLVGYSMGARVALGCALAVPERIAHLIFISGNPGIASEERDARWRRDEIMIDQLRGTPARQFLSEWYTQSVFGPLTTETIASWAERRSPSLDVVRQADLLSAYSVAHQPNYWEHLNDVSFPLTAVMGERDAKYLEIGRRMAACSATRLEVIPGVGHAVHREAPKEVGSIFCDIVATLESEKGIS